VGLCQRGFRSVLLGIGMNGMETENQGEPATLGFFWKMAVKRYYMAKCVAVFLEIMEIKL